MVKLVPAKTRLGRLARLGVGRLGYKARQARLDEFLWFESRLFSCSIFPFLFLSVLSKLSAVTGLRVPGPSTVTTAVKKSYVVAG